MFLSPGGNCSQNHPNKNGGSPAIEWPPERRKLVLNPDQYIITHLPMLGIAIFAAIRVMARLPRKGAIELKAQWCFPRE